MNFKKIVSAVSALAISVSAFAGLAVTAQAEDTVYLNDEFSYTVASKFLSSGQTTTYGLIDYVAYDRSGAITGNASMKGSYLEVYATRFANANRGVQMTFSENAGIPTVAELANDAILELSFKVKCSSTSAFVISGYGTITSETIGTTDWATVALTLNKATGKQTLSVDDSVKSVSDITVTELTGLAFTDTTGTDSKTNQYYSIDDLKVEQRVAPATPSHIMTINAVDGNGTLIKELTAVSVQEGDTYAFTGIPEVVENNGAYYQLSSSVDNHTAIFTMGNADATESVTYIEDSSIVAYIEGESMAAQHSSYSAVYEDVAYSNGQARTTQGGAGEKIYKSITLADGIYTFVVGQGARKSSKNEPYTGNIMLDDTVIGEMAGAASGTNVDTFTDITVNADTYELRAAVTNSAIAPVDYIIIKKTADIPAPPTASVSAESAVKEGYITFKGEIANAATVDRAGFGFVNLSDAVGSTALQALWTTNVVQNNTFGAAIEQQKGATHSAFYAVPYIVVNGNAVFGNVVASDWND